MIVNLFMKTSQKKYTNRREDMVSKQIEARGLTDLRVLAALRKVPRHLFVSEAMMDQAYMDYPLPIGEQQTISQPFIVAEMTQALQLSASDRVLEIGTGSGYQSAVLAEIVSKVYTIERKKSLFIKARKLFDELEYFNIIARYTDGTIGWQDESPFNAIIVTAGSPAIPEALVEQLAVGGRMVIPVGDEHSQNMILIHKKSEGIKQENLGRCRFVKLIGKHGWAPQKKQWENNE